MTPHAIRDRVCAICLALPEATMEGDRHLGFSVRGRRFAWLVDDHHGDSRLAIHCKAPPGENTVVVGTDAERYFLPPYLALLHPEHRVTSRWPLKDNPAADPVLSPHECEHAQPVAPAPALDEVRQRRRVRLDTPTGGV